MVVLACLVAGGRAEAQTRAGTTITNVARAQAAVGDATVQASSNAASFTVAERLDVALAQGDRPAPTSAQTALPATLTNRGNGSEAFALAATAPAGVTVRGIAIDGDGDGAFDPAHDTLLTDGATTPLDPGASVSLLMLVDRGADPGASGAVTLVARAVTGSGAVGTTFAGAGDGGSDAVVGPTGAQARLAVTLAGVPSALPTLVKSQSVRAPDGGDQPVAGAIVTYTLQATFADARRAARIDDPIPTGTRYVAGSLSLDGVALTDAADGDPGSVDAAVVSVSLGDVAPSGGTVTRTVRFQTTLQ